MKETPIANFGLLIAYVLPGFIALWGIGISSPAVMEWLRGESGHCPTVGGFLYATLASIILGMTVNAIRWVTLDALHHRTGIRYPSWDFAELQANLGGYDKLVDFYFRYHEWFGNCLISGVFTYTVWRSGNPGWHYLPADLACLALATLFWFASRDTLRKFYRRVEQLLHP